jgi:5-azacytidine-induced protein 1
MTKTLDIQKKELKQQREFIASSEKSKREAWIRERTKEIKEETVKNLEPEIQRMLAVRLHLIKTNKSNIKLNKDSWKIV